MVSRQTLSDLLGRGLKHLRTISGLSNEAVGGGLGANMPNASLPANPLNPPFIPPNGCVSSMPKRLSSSSAAG